MKAAASSHPLHFDRHFAKISVSTSLRGGAAVLASSTGVPPLKLWIGPSLLCALSYALYNIFIKKASSSIDPLLGGALLQFVAALLGTLLLVGKRALGKSASVPTRANGVLWAIAAGAAVGAAEILSFSISSMGVQAMQSIPIVIGGSVLFGTVLGTVVLKEVLGVRGWSGVILIAAGIALVGLDPGTSGLH
jgi:transporter family protein